MTTTLSRSSCRIQLLHGIFASIHSDGNALSRCVLNSMVVVSVSWDLIIGTKALLLVSRCEGFWPVQKSCCIDYCVVFSPSQFFFSVTTITHEPLHLAP